MRRFRPLLAAAVAFAIATPGQAQSLILDAPNPPAPALPQLAHGATAGSQVRELPLTAAETLLKSTEGPAWHAFSVHGPACASKKRAKQCSEIRRACALAQKFSRKHGLHATCSTLYEHSTVLLTNAPQHISGAKQ